jgi:hypothetical protein
MKKLRLIFSLTAILCLFYVSAVFATVTVFWGSTTSRAVAKSATTSINLTVRLNRPAPTGGVTVGITESFETSSSDFLAPAQSDQHDYGLGKDYSLSTRTLTFAKREQSKTLTFTPANNKVINFDKRLVLTLTVTSGDAKIATGGSELKIKLTDPNRHSTYGIINVNTVADDFPELSVSNVLPDTKDSDCTTELQALIDKVYSECVNRTPSKGVVLYFPAGTYNIKELVSCWNLTFVGTGDATVLKRPAKRLIGNPTSITRHATNPTVTMPGHGLATSDLVVFSGVTQTDWTVLNGDTRGGHLYVITRINNDSFTMRHQDGSALETSGFAAAYASASNPSAAMSQCYKWRRTIQAGATPYIWNSADDAPPVVVTKMKFDGNNAQQGPYQHHNLEQAAFISAYANPASAGRAILRVQEVNFYDGPGDGVLVGQNSNVKVYNCTGTNVFRGTVTVTGGYTSTEIKDVEVWGPIDTGGVQLELDGAGYGGSYASSVVIEDVTLNNGGFDLGAGPGPSTITATRVKSYVPATGASRQFGFWLNLYLGSSLNSITLNDCDLYAAAYVSDPNRQKIKGASRLQANNCRFYLSGGGDTTPAAGDKCPIIQIEWLNKDGCVYEFNDCTFALDTTYSPIPSTVQRLAMMDSAIDGDGTSYVKFNGCTFDSGLDGIIGDNGYGRHAIFEDCTMNAACRLVNGTQVYALAFSGYDSANKNWDLTLNNCTLNATYPFYIYGYANATACKSNWLRIKSMTLTDPAKNIMGTFNGFTNNNFINSDAKHPTSMARGTTTTVTCTGHGLADGDKVMFDGIDEAVYADWFAGLCPHTNVPIFTVSGVSGNTFVINLNSSGYAANYSGATDTAGVFWKHPGLRIIQNGTANPTTGKPAGFAGDRYIYNSTNYRCKTSGVLGSSAWEAE